MDLTQASDEIDEIEKQIHAYADKVKVNSGLGNTFSDGIGIFVGTFVGALYSNAEGPSAYRGAWTCWRSSGA